MNNSLNLALKQASRELSVDVKTVEAVYNSYWKFIRESIEQLPLKTISEEEFNSVIHNFNIPFIGKLYAEYNKIKKYNNQLNYYQNVKTKKN